MSSRLYAPCIVLGIFLLAAGCSKSPAPDVTAPGAVTDLRISAATDTSVTVSWTAPGGDGDLGRAASYDLRFAKEALPRAWDSAIMVPLDTPPQPAGETESALLTGLIAETPCWIALTAADAAGNVSEFSNVLRVDLTDPVPPARILDLSAGGVTPHGVTLWFTAPGDDDTEGVAARYEARASAQAITDANWNQASEVDLSWVAPAQGGEPETIRVTTFQPDTTLHISVRARDDSQNLGQVSNDLVVTFPVDTVAPDPVDDLRLVETGLYTARLAWTGTGNDGPEAQVLGYEVRYSRSPVTEATWTNAAPAALDLPPGPPGTAEAADISNLPGGNDLWFAIRGFDEAGNMGPLSNPVSGLVFRDPKRWVVSKDGMGDALTIQAGVDSAAADDTVFVVPGVYEESITLRGRDVVLLGSGPGETIVDARLADSSCLRIISGESRSTVVRGFTFTGGTGTHASGYSGSGILVFNACPQIIGNRITNNSAPAFGFGGGMYLGGTAACTPLVQDNEIVSNSSGNGGGIAVSGMSKPEIRGNWIHNNSTTHGDGGGIWVNVAIDGIVMDNNLFQFNTAGDKGGGVVASLGTDALPSIQITISNNVFFRNTSNRSSALGPSGGALWMHRVDAWVHHNTFAFNQGFGSGDGTLGGGIAITKCPTSIIEQNIIAYTGVGGAIYCSESSVVIRNNLAWDNPYGHGNGDCPTWVSQDGNIEAHPEFCHTRYDFHLAATSPALSHPAGPLGALPMGCEVGSEFSVWPEPDPGM